jgi:hypothetical protein
MEKLCRFYTGDINVPLCNFRERTSSTIEPSMAEAIGEEGEWDEDFDKCISVDRNRELNMIIADQKQCNMYQEDIGESGIEKVISLE